MFAEIRAEEPSQRPAKPRTMRGRQAPQEPRRFRGSGDARSRGRRRVAPQQWGSGAATVAGVGTSRKSIVKLNGAAVFTLISDEMNCFVSSEIRSISVAVPVLPHG